MAWAVRQADLRWLGRGDSSLFLLQKRLPATAILNMAGYMNDVLWHYAPWEYLGEIITSGCLKVSNAGASRERPLLWFSTNQHWEPTATKFLRTAEGLVKLTFDEQAAYYGCIRFGLMDPDTRLLHWRDACRAAGTPRQLRRKLERAGTELGANPSHWFAVATNVPLGDLLFQVWLGEMGWRNANAAEMASIWAEHRIGAQCP